MPVATSGCTGLFHKGVTELADCQAPLNYHGGGGGHLTKLCMNMSYIRLAVYGSIHENCVIAKFSCHAHSYWYMGDLLESGYFILPPLSPV